MSCSQIQKQMQSLLFEQRRMNSTDTELNDHLAGCSECQAEWQRLQTLAVAIHDWRASVPAIDIADRVVAEIVRHQPFGNDAAANRELRPLLRGGSLPVSTGSHAGLSSSGARTSRRALFAALTGLAALLGVTAMLDRPSPPQRHPDVQSVANSSRSEPRAALEIAQGPDVRTFVSGVGSAYLAFVQDTAGVVNSATTLALPDSLRSTDAASNDASALPWLEGVGRGWEPIQKSVGTMIDTFLNPTPADDPSAT
ncbi:MAG: hypothetical protein HZA46_04605 [Planctomycetales bacterium]|nr:hypothetical protein [Planctomycetales bacterium]